jgi:tetratricopeptide (TPR) repeat protein
VAPAKKTTKPRAKRRKPAVVNKAAAIGRKKRAAAEPDEKKRASRPGRAKAARAASPEPKILPVEVEPGSIETTLKNLRDELAHWVNKGRYTKVRFRLRGKPILPDIPVGALLAAEAVTFWWAGLLQALLVNLGAKALLEVELVSEAELEVARGKQALLGGDLDRAMEIFLHAAEMDRDCASAYLNLGICHKLKGERDEARKNLERAEQLDPAGTVGEEARRLLDSMAGLRQPAAS